VVPGAYTGSYKAPASCVPGMVIADSNKVSGNFDIHDCPEEESDNGSGEVEVLHDEVKRARQTSDSLENRLIRMFYSFQLRLLIQNFPFSIKKIRKYRLHYYINIFKKQIPFEGDTKPH
jgi:hypothetical protein